jgi:hypothetical protein
VPLLLGSLAFGQRSLDECGTVLMPKTLSIHVKETADNVNVFTPICDGGPCDPSQYIFEWKFADQDYSVAQSPERWFARPGVQRVCLTLGGIKESDDPARLGGAACPPAVVQAGGCISVITPDCGRKYKDTCMTFDVKGTTRDRHEEFGKQLSLQRGDYRMLIASPDGSPVPNQRAQYPVVLENLSACPAKATITITSNLKKTGMDAALLVKKGGSSIALRRNGTKIEVTTTVPAGATIVMLLEAQLPAMKLGDLGEDLHLDAKAEFEPLQRGAGCRSKSVKFEREDVVLWALDPSYLKLLTHHPITLGDRVRYKMIVTNDGTANPNAVTIFHELDPIWDRNSIKYKYIKIDGRRIQKEKHDEKPEPGEYYLHHRMASDTSTVMVIKPSLKHPLAKGVQLVVKFKARLKKHAPKGWEGDDPGSLKLPRNDRFVRNSFWTLFDIEGIWYESNSEPPTIIKPKIWKVWRFFRFGAFLITTAAAAAVVVERGGS